MCGASGGGGGSGVADAVNLLSLSRAMQPAPAPPAPTRRADTSGRMAERQRRLASQGIAGTNVTGGMATPAPSLGRASLLGQGGT